MALRSLPIAVGALMLVWGCPPKGAADSAAAEESPAAAAEETAIDTAPTTGTVLFGVLPAVGADKAKESYAPLTAELSKALGRPVELRIAEDYGMLLSDIIDGSVHLAQVSAHLYVTGAVLRSKVNKSTDVLAQERKAAGDVYRGVIVVPAASKAAALADLKGKKMLYVDQHSSSGHIYPRMKIRDSGLDPDDLFASTTFGGSHDAVIAKLKAGEADAGAVSERSAAMSGLKVLEKTDAIPEDAVVALGGLSGEERSQARAVFLGADKNPALGNYFIGRGIERYVPAVIEIYDAAKKEVGKTPGALGQ